MPRNAEPVRCGRREISDFLAVDVDGSRIRPVRPRDDFDQSGFARAVFAEQRMNFAAKQFERNAVQRAHSAKDFVTFES